MGDNPEFDPSLKKKKKKKKKKTEEEGAEEPAPAAEDEAPAAAEPVEGDFSEKKKKKKKKKPAADADAGAASDDDDESWGTFKPTRAKKKRKIVKQGDLEAAAAEGEQGGDDMEDGSDDDAVDASAGGVGPSEVKQKKAKKVAPIWVQEDRKITYDELLSRIFAMLNPAIADKKAFKMKPPVVVREGTKRVVLVNFQELVTSMNRSSEHLLNYMLAELGTSGSQDAMGRVTFKYAGRQAQKHMESVIKAYVKEYVLCKLCKSSDTKLNKDSATRLYFMVCGSCGASRSVNPIKTGFQAQIGKRKKKL